MVCRRGMEVDEVAPDHLRCGKSNGQKWRCPRRTIDGTRFCDNHHHLTRHCRLKKEEPSSPKLHRKPRRKAAPVQPEPPNHLPMVVHGLTKRGMHANEVAPDHLRCRRRDGKQWRCPRRAMDGISFCDYHHQLSRRCQLKKEVPNSPNPHRKPRRKIAPVQAEPHNHLPMVVHRPTKQGMNVDEVAPEHLRCRRRDGKQWQCPRRAMDGISFCHYHCQLSRRSQLKKKVLDSGGIEQIRNQNGRKDRRSHRDLPMELITMVLRRQMERREEKKNEATAVDEEEAKEEAAVEVMRDLPNGVMAISPAAPVGSTCNASALVNWKLGFDSGSFMRRCFRSKNVELPPLVTSQMFPNGKDDWSLGKCGKRICHQRKSNARESSFRRATGKNFSAPGV